MEHSFRFCNSDVVYDPALVEPGPLPLRFPITSIALDVAGVCNLKCVYCAEAVTQPKRKPMSKKVMEKALEALFAWAPEGSDISIHLGSGEPLLQPETVQEIGFKAREMARGRHKLRLYLTTNGTLLTDDICTWLIRDEWSVKVSLDGTAQIHDKNRRDAQGGTYKRIEGYILKLAQKIPDLLSTTSVLCRGTDPRDVFYGIHNLGVRRMEFVPVAAEYPSAMVLNEIDIARYQKFLSDYTHRIVHGESLPFLVRFTKRVQRVLGFGNSRVACGAGRNFISIGPDGVLYPCFRFIGVSRYELGTLNSMDSHLLQKFMEEAGRPYDKRKACLNCWAAPLCGGPCFACAELLYYRNGEPSPDFCSMMKADCEAAVWLVQELREENPEQLVAFMGISLEEE